MTVDFTKTEIEKPKLKIKWIKKWIKKLIWLIPEFIIGAIVIVSILVIVHLCSMLAEEKKMNLTKYVLKYEVKVIGVGLVAQRYKCESYVNKGNIIYLFDQNGVLLNEITIPKDIQVIISYNK